MYSDRVETKETPVEIQKLVKIDEESIIQEFHQKLANNAIFEGFVQTE